MGGTRATQVRVADADRTDAAPQRTTRPRFWRRHPVVSGVLAVVVAVGVVWGVKLAQVGASIARYQAYWEQPRGQPGGLLYAALGDSAAQGIGASRPELGYVGLLADRMREQTGRPVQVVNLSRSGATLEDLVDEQLPRLRALRPDVVTVAIGGNDVRSFDVTRFAQHLEELMAGLPAGSVVADVPWFMHGRWEDDAELAGTLVTRSAQARGLPVVPLHAALRARGASSMLTDFAADGFHPNDRGHRQWADAMWVEVRRVPALARQG